MPAKRFGKILPPSLISNSVAQEDLILITDPKIPDAEIPSRPTPSFLAGRAEDQWDGL